MFMDLKIMRILRIKIFKFIIPTKRVFIHIAFLFFPRYRLACVVGERNVVVESSICACKFKKWLPFLLITEAGISNS